MNSNKFSLVPGQNSVPGNYTYFLLQWWLTTPY